MLRSKLLNRPSSTQTLSMSSAPIILKECCNTAFGQEAFPSPTLSVKFESLLRTCLCNRSTRGKTESQMTYTSVLHDLKCQWCHSILCICEVKNVFAHRCNYDWLPFDIFMTNAAIQLQLIWLKCFTQFFKEPSSCFKAFFSLDKMHSPCLITFVFNASIITISLNPG